MPNASRYAICRPNDMQKMRLNTSQFDLSGLGCWLTILVFLWMLGSVGLGWLVKSFAILVVLIFAVPAVAFFGFRWWLKRNLVEDQCPVCSYQFTGLNQTQLSCPNCGEPLQVEGGHFTRLVPPGTIDVQAVEVSPKQLED